MIHQSCKAVVTVRSSTLQNWNGFNLFSHKAKGEGVLLTKSPIRKHQSEPQLLYIFSLHVFEFSKTKIYAIYAIIQVNSQGC